MSLLNVLDHGKKKNLCKCFVSSTTFLFLLFWLSHICSVFPLFRDCFYLTFDSFLSDVVVVFSNSSPCHDHGDHSRWPSAPWLNHSPLHLHYSLLPLTVCSPGGEVYVSLSSTDITSYKFLFGFTMCQIILIWLKLSKYYTKFHILSTRVMSPHGHVWGRKINLELFISGQKEVVKVEDMSLDFI